MSTVYSTKEANESLLKATNNEYSLAGNYINTFKPMPIKNNQTGAIEISSVNNIKTRYAARVRNHGHKYQIDKLFGKKYTLAYFKSGDYCFPGIMVSHKTYLRMRNVVNYLNLNYSTLYNHLPQSHKKCMLTVSSRTVPANIRNAYFSDNHRKPSISFVTVKALFNALNRLLKNKRIRMNKELATSFLNDLYETYKNEINGLTQIQLALDNHNKKVDKINKTSVNTGQAMENIVKNKTAPSTSSTNFKNQFSLNDVRHIVNQKVDQAVNTADDRITRNYEWQLDVLRKKLRKYPKWDDILNLKETNHKIKKELTHLQAKVNRQPWYKRVLSAAFN